MPGSPGGKEVGRLSLKVLPDTSDFFTDLKAFAERVEEEVKIRIPVELDRLQAMEELRELQAAMETAETQLDIGVELDGAGAMAHLDILLAAMQGTADLNPINVDLDIDQAKAVAELAATNAAMEGMSSGAGTVGRNIAIWGPLIAIALVGLAAIAPALLVIFPLIAGIGLGIGALIAGWGELKDVIDPIVKMMKGIQEEVGKILTLGLKPLIAEFASGFMPLVVDGLERFARIINRALQGLLEFLGSAEGMQLMADVVQALAMAFEPFSHLVAPLVELFMRLVVAAAPGLTLIGNTLLRVTDNLNEFLASGDHSGAIIDSINQIGEVFVILGDLVADMWPTLIASIEPTIAFLRGFAAGIGMVFQVMAPVAALLGKVTPLLEVLGAMLGVAAIAWAVVTGAVALFNLVMAANPISLIIIAIAALVAGIVYAYQNFETFRGIVDAVWGFLKTVFTVGIAVIAAVWNNFWTNLQGPLQAAWAVIQTVVRVGLVLITTYFRVYWAIISAVVTAAIAIVMAVIRVGIATVLGIVRGISAVVGFFRSAWNTAKDAVHTAITGIYDFVRAIPGRVSGMLSNLGGLLVSAGRALIQGFIDGIGEMFGAVQGKLGELTGKLTSWKGPESLDKVILFDSGRFVIQGFLDGLESQYGAVEKSLGAFTDGLGSSAAFDMSGSVGASTVTAPLMRAIDGALDAGLGGGATRVVFDDWQKGLAWFETIAGDKVGAYEAANAADGRMGAPPR